MHALFLVLVLINGGALEMNRFSLSGLIVFVTVTAACLACLTVHPMIAVFVLALSIFVARFKIAGPSLERLSKFIFAGLCLMLLAMAFVNCECSEETRRVLWMFEQFGLFRRSLVKSWCGPKWVPVGAWLGIVTWLITTRPTPVTPVDN